MPSSWLKVPHFRQELEYSCIPACVRMVLAHYGAIRTEADLRLLLDTKPTGTRAGNLMRLSGPDFEVHLRSSNLVELQQVLADNQPAIVFLKTGSLQYWSLDIFHTAVLTGIDTETAAPRWYWTPHTTKARSAATMTTEKSLRRSGLMRSCCR